MAINGGDIMNLHLKVNKRILGISFVIVLIATIILSPVQKLYSQAASSPRSGDAITILGKPCRKAILFL